MKRISVSWGGGSLINAELILLEEATKSNHSYYHLISGVDYPIRSQDYIHKFFLDNYGKEFIKYDENKNRISEFQNRVRYYYFFQNLIGRNKGKITALLCIFQKFLLIVQKMMYINRLKHLHFDVYKGANWFSITHDMASYIVQNKKKINKFCKYSFCADEIFLQTMAMVSPYRDKIVNNYLRYIDWKRGDPYVFTDDDYQELVVADKLFARKFDDYLSSDIVEKIYNNIIKI